MGILRAGRAKHFLLGLGYASTQCIKTNVCTPKYKSAGILLPTYVNTLHSKSRHFLLRFRLRLACIFSYMKKNQLINPSSGTRIPTDHMM